MDSSARTELNTIRDLIRYAVTCFCANQLTFGHGSDNAYDEAVYLVLHTLHLPPDTLEPLLDSRVLRHEATQVLDLINERVQSRLPAAYLTQEAWLRGRRFYVDKRVIVPRSPISELLDQGLAPWVTDPLQVLRALDMCTGSGCLAILTAQTFPQAQVDAVDLSADALAVAALNVTDYDLQDRVHLHQSDLFNDLPLAPYDVIVCNPPYVNQSSMQALPSEFKHEPVMALAGGHDGMDLVRRILDQASSYLSENGIIVLEIGYERRHFVAAFPDLSPIWLATETTNDHILVLTQEQLTA
jgi:ribosomal protein L3 glutamine methyltransferase